MKGRGNGRSLRKPADQRHRLGRFPHVKIRNDPGLGKGCKACWLDISRVWGGGGSTGGPAAVNYRPAGAPATRHTLRCALPQARASAHIDITSSPSQPSPAQGSSSCTPRRLATAGQTHLQPPSWPDVLITKDTADGLHCPISAALSPHQYIGVVDAAVNEEPAGSPSKLTASVNDPTPISTLFSIRVAKLELTSALRGHLSSLAHYETLHNYVFLPLASHQGESGSIPDRFTPDYRMRESCLTMALVGGVFFEDLPFPPPIRSGVDTYSLHFIGSQDLALTCARIYAPAVIPRSQEVEVGSSAFELAFRKAQDAPSPTPLQRSFGVFDDQLGEEILHLQELQRFITSDQIYEAGKRSRVAPEKARIKPGTAHEQDGNLRGDNRKVGFLKPSQEETPRTLASTVRVEGATPLDIAPVHTSQVSALASATPVSTLQHHPSRFWAEQLPRSEGRTGENTINFLVKCEEYTALFTLNDSDMLHCLSISLASTAYYWWEVMCRRVQGSLGAKLHSELFYSGKGRSLENHLSQLYERSSRHMTPPIGNEEFVVMVLNQLPYNYQAHWMGRTDSDPPAERAPPLYTSHPPRYKGDFRTDPPPREQAYQFEYSDPYNNCEFVEQTDWQRLYRRDTPVNKEELRQELIDIVRNKLQVAVYQRVRCAKKLRVNKLEPEDLVLVGASYLSRHWDYIMAQLLLLFQGPYEVRKELHKNWSSAMRTLCLPVRSENCIQEASPHVTALHFNTTSLHSLFIIARTVLYRAHATGDVCISTANWESR
ncbi:hypothetical protein PR048_014459 [Dryococelus australis]|uniref:Uncharacterized protein n=1 Tax=Dryococelus australis TaxID=614101 RepID=A0ABQ9HEA2_9NEOP|nr:hypothetical protein PR048_014459 [Dryococelus australis]